MIRSFNRDTAIFSHAPPRPEATTLQDPDMLFNRYLSVISREVSNRIAVADTWGVMPQVSPPPTPALRLTQGVGVQLPLVDEGYSLDDPPPPYRERDDTSLVSSASIGGSSESSQENILVPASSPAPSLAGSSSPPAPSPPAAASSPPAHSLAGLSSPAPPLASSSPSAAASSPPASLPPTSSSPAIPELQSSSQELTPQSSQPPPPYTPFELRPPNTENRPQNIWRSMAYYPPMPPPATPRLEPEHAQPGFPECRQSAFTLQGQLQVNQEPQGRLGQRSDGHESSGSSDSAPAGRQRPPLVRSRNYQPSRSAPVREERSRIYNQPTVHGSQDAFLLPTRTPTRTPTSATASTAQPQPLNNRPPELARPYGNPPLGFGPGLGFTLPTGDGYSELWDEQTYREYLRLLVRLYLSRFQRP